MFHGTDNEAKNRNDKNCTGTDESDDEVEWELLPPCLTNVLALHLAPGQDPTEQDPALTRQHLLDDLGGLVLHDFIWESLFSH